MRKPGARAKWIVAALLFGGFLAELALDLTGLALHQWLGMGVAVLAGYHLLVHREWVASVSRRLFGKASARVRGFYVVDAGLLVGFLGIIVTGLAVSSWLNLPLADYQAWLTAHVALSLGTLWLIVVKISMHIRWIAGVASGSLLPTVRAARPMLVRAEASVSHSRRDAIRMMGSVGALAALGSAWVLADEVDASTPETEASLEAGTAAASAPTVDGTQIDVMVSELAESEAAVAEAATATAMVTATGEPTVAATTPAEATATATATTVAVEPTVTATAALATSCTVRCRRGCSYPGHCGKYTDSNGNNLCDFGECL